MNDDSRAPLEPEVLSGSIPEREGPATFPEGPGGSYPPAVAAPAPHRPKFRLPLILFVLTCASTFYAGTGQFPVPKTSIDPRTGQRTMVIKVDPATRRARRVIDWPQTLLNGFTYAAGVLAILAAHEMGHYLQARRYGVPATLPLFIPMPFSPIGTMGAVIVQQPGVADRSSLFDIAISGPLAGLVVALPLNWWGIAHSTIGKVPAQAVGWTNPRIVEWMIAWIHRPLQPGEDINLNPILFAGWVGIFITALNLIPIGQLDGGHILYCLVGRAAHVIARLLFLGAAGFVIFQVARGHVEYSGWTLMLALLWLMGTRHPPTANDRMPLGKTRIVLGWLTLAFVLIGFVPAPMYESQGPDQPPAQIQGDTDKEIEV